MTKPERVSDATERARASIKDAIRIVAGYPATSGWDAPPSPPTDATASAAPVARTRRQPQ